MFRIFSKLNAWLWFLLVITLYTSSFVLLIDNSNQNLDKSEFLQISNILYYSTIQALLSSSISILVGIIVARAFFYLHFKGKNFLYKTIISVWALPAVVVIFSLIGFWGIAGWFNNFLQLLGFKKSFNIYGLQGILLGHCFFNIPFATKQILESLQTIPKNNLKIADQLNFSPLNKFRLIELPIIKNILPKCFITIFLLCFTSFPIVLMLGGSPKYSTLEVAIYQAVNFEVNFTKAGFLVLVQLVLSLIILAILQKDKFQKGNAIINDNCKNLQLCKSEKLLLKTILILVSLFIFLPLFTLIVEGFKTFLNPENLDLEIIFKAILNSILLSLISAGFALWICFFIANEITTQNIKKHRRQFFNIISILPLVVPVSMLATGLFIIFQNWNLNNFTLILIIGFCNSFALIPFIFHPISNALLNTKINQNKLAQSLGLKDWNRFKILELPCVKNILINNFILAISASFGSFTLFAFFSEQNLITLPILIYQQLGSYKIAQASFTSLILLVLTILPFIFNKTKNLNH